MSQAPLPPPPIQGNSPLDRWLNILYRRIGATGQLLWAQISFTGSNLTDLATRNHSDLQNINTASYTHLTSTQATDLTYGGDTALHSHSAFVGDSGAGGQKGMVPAPIAGDSSKYLKGDGSWGAPSSGGNPSNVIASDTTIDTDTSYVVVDYLTVNASLTINGNVGVI